MTLQCDVATNEKQNRADINRARKIQAVREFQRLIDEALAPEFTGTIAVEVNAKEGRLAPPKVTRIHWPNE